MKSHIFFFFFLYFNVNTGVSYSLYYNRDVCSTYDMLTYRHTSQLIDAIYRIVVYTIYVRTCTCVIYFVCTWYDNYSNNNDFSIGHDWRVTQYHNWTSKNRCFIFQGNNNNHDNNKPALAFE